MDSVILVPKNGNCTLINTHILNQIPGEQRTYGYDKIICANDNDINNYSVEFLNSLTKLFVVCHHISWLSKVLLIRHLNTKEALVNRTRMHITFMHRNAIELEV